MEKYYQDMVELQEKLRKSEQERYKLEEKFNEMIRNTRDFEQEKLRILRHKYNKFIEQDKKRQERNTEIFRSLERIEIRASSFAAKTERYRNLRKQYAIYLKTKQNSSKDEKPQQINIPQKTQYHPNIRKQLFSEESYDSKVAKSKINMLEQYIRENNDTEKYLNNFSEKKTPNYDNFLDKIIRNSSLNDTIYENINARLTQENLSRLQKEILHEKGLQRFPNYQFEDQFGSNNFSPYSERKDTLDLRTKRTDQGKEADIYIDVPQSNNKMKPYSEIDISPKYFENLTPKSFESQDTCPKLKQEQILTRVEQKTEEKPIENLKTLEETKDKLLNPKILEQTNQIYDENVDSQNIHEDKLKINQLHIKKEHGDLSNVEEKQIHVNQDVQGDQLNKEGAQNNEDEQNYREQKYEVEDYGQEESKVNVEHNQDNYDYQQEKYQTEEYQQNVDQYQTEYQENIDDQPQIEIQENLDASYQNVDPQYENVDANYQKEEYQQNVEEYQTEYPIDEQQPIEGFRENVDNMYQNVDPQFKTQEISQNIDPNSQKEETDYQNVDPQYQRVESEYQNIDPQYQTEENPQNLDLQYQNVDSEYQNVDSEYQNDDSQYQKEGNVQNVDPQYQNVDSEYQNVGSKYQNVDSEYQNVEPQYQTEEYQQNVDPQYQNLDSEYQNVGSDYQNVDSEYQNVEPQYQTEEYQQNDDPQYQNDDFANQNVEPQYQTEEYQQNVDTENQIYDSNYQNVDPQYQQVDTEYQNVDPQYQTEEYQQNVDPQYQTEEYQQNVDPQYQTEYQQEIDPQYQPEYTENVVPEYQTDQYQQNVNSQYQNVDPNQQYEYQTDQQYPETYDQQYNEVNTDQVNQPDENFAQKDYSEVAPHEESSISDNIGNIDAILSDKNENSTQKKGQNLGKLLESDTESSFKQDTKISNDSDFDFSQNN